jgi:hypothetical protein
MLRAGAKAASRPGGVWTSPDLAFGINSALAFASAELLTAALHETGHGLAAQALGFSPRIYAFFENNPDGTTTQSLIILASGPLASLVLGALFLALFWKQKPHYRFGRLLLFWLAWLGILEFVNYLIVTPWLSAGDTARIADLLGWAVLPRYAFAAIGVAFVVLLARPAAVSMCATAPATFALDLPAARRRFIFRAFYLPLFAGTVLTAFGGLGGQSWAVALGLFGTLGNSDLIGFAFRASRGPIVFRERAEDARLRVEPLGVALYLAIVLGYVAVLSRGVRV